MAAERPFAGSNAAAVLAVLTTATNFEHKIGDPEEARRSRPPRVVWVPGRATFTGPPTDARTDVKVAAQRARAFKVYFFGRDFEDAERLQDATIAALFNHFSEYSYQLGDEEPPEGGDLEHAGFELIQEITLLRIPIAAEQRTRVTLTGAVATGAARNMAGASSVAATITVP